tara:strand:- start:209 stop:1042 length:834 start_codon:yes stop_codon:yes gene_type:complete
MKTKDKIFRKNLSRAFKMSVVNEGLFDDIINFLGGLDTKWSDSLSSTQGAALPNIPDKIEPRESAQDQLHAVVCVCQAVGYSVEGIIQSAQMIAEDLEMLGSYDESEDIFTQAQSILSDTIRMTGEATGWLQNDTLRDCSDKVAGIGDDISIEETASSSVKELAKSLQDINNLNIDGEIEKIIKTEAVVNLLDKDPYWSDRGKTFIEEGLVLIKQIPEAIDTLKELEIQILALEKLLEQKSEEPEVAATADVMASSVFESAVVNIYKRILSEKNSGS